MVRKERTCWLANAKRLTVAASRPPFLSAEEGLLASRPCFGFRLSATLVRALPIVNAAVYCVVILYSGATSR